MAPAILSLFLIQPGPLPKAPVTETLRQAREWSVWQADDKARFDQALGHLAKRNFKEADRLNRSLLARAPKSIFDDPPTLPLVMIKPSGSDAVLPADKPMSGWRWRRESAWLSVWAGDNERAFSEFQAVMASSQTEALPAVEGALFTLARLRRWQDCLSLADQTRVGGSGLRAVYFLASQNRWNDLRTTALGVSPSRPQGTGSPPPTLSGAIGGRRQVLPSSSQPPLLPTKSPSTGPSWASIEASLIILDSKLGALRLKKGDTQANESVLFWVNILLRDAREAFPHHRQAAYSALESLKK